MKNILICHSRCGSTSLFQSIKDNSPKKIEWGVHHKEGEFEAWNYNEFYELDYSLARLHVDNTVLTKKDKERLSKELNCIYMYRENTFDVGVSLSIGYYTKIWQPHSKNFEGYYDQKITIQKNILKERVRLAKEIKEEVLSLCGNGFGFSYESVYNGGEKETLNRINDFCCLDLDVDSAVKQLKQTQRFNNYSNVTNMEEIQEWRKEWLTKNEEK
jgi:hypothetical protein